MTRLATILIVIATTGCSFSNSALNGNTPIDANRRLVAGTFTGHYAGTFTLTQCDSHTLKNGSMSFTGSGSNSFMFKSGEAGSMSSIIHHLPLGCGPWEGSATLSSVNHPENSIGLRLSLQDAFGHPCSTLRFTVTGGTGRFKNATGNGTATMSCANGNYSSVFSGAIKF